MDKRDLQKYRRLAIELEMLEEKIARLDTVLKNPKNQILSDMPRGGVSKDTVDRVIRLIELKALCDERWDELIDERIRIESELNKLTDPVQRTIMNYRYLLGYEWEDICEKIKYSSRNVYYLHGQALKNLADHCS